MTDSESLTKSIVQEVESDLLTDQRIQEVAYLKWLAATNGSPVSQEQTDQFWFAAKEEVLESQN